MGFPRGSDGKESACNAGEVGSVPESGRSPGEENGNPLQYSCLANSIFTQIRVCRRANFLCQFEEGGEERDSKGVCSRRGGKLQYYLWHTNTAQSCPTLCDPMDCSPPGSSVHGILQARILEWGAISFSRDLPNPEIKPGSPAQKTDSLPSEPPGKPKVKNVYHALNVFGKGKKSYRTTDRKHHF